MAENKMCPHCGGQMFMATITRACVIEATTDSDNPYNILREGKDKYDIEILKCARCKEEVQEENLITGVQCKECGRMVSPADIDENGVCNVCIAVQKRTELANASREDLIKMLLDAEKKANPVAVKMEKQIEKADEVTSIASKDTENTEDVNETEEDKPKTRRKARKKKTDDADTEEQINESSNDDSEISEEQTEETSETTEVIDDIANQQEAPFPEISTSEESSVELPAEEQPVGADFHMFDNEEEPF